MQRADYNLQEDFQLLGVLAPLTPVLFKGRLYTRERKTSVPSQAAFIITAPMWRQPKCPPAEEWIHKIGRDQAVEYYSAAKSDGIL